MKRFLLISIILLSSCSVKKEPVAATSVPAVPDIKDVVDKFIIEIEAQLEDKGVSLSINNEAKAYLVDEGYDEVYGARELGRIIQEKVKKPMAEELIFGKLSKGGHVEITCKDSKISFEFSNKQEVKKELA